MANTVLTQSGQEVQSILNKADKLPSVTSGDEGKTLQVNSSGNIVANTVSSGMTNPMTTAGDIIYGGSSGAATRLAKGTAGQVLTMNSGATAPEWQTPSGGGMSNPMTAAGDIIVGGSSGTPTRLAKGTAGQVLKVNSAGTGLEWGSGASGGGTQLYQHQILLGNEEEEADVKEIILINTSSASINTKSKFLQSLQTYMDLKASSLMGWVTLNIYAIDNGEGHQAIDFDIAVYDIGHDLFGPAIITLGETAGFIYTLATYDVVAFDNSGNEYDIDVFVDTVTAL